MFTMSLNQACLRRCVPRLLTIALSVFTVAAPVARATPNLVTDTQLLGGREGELALAGSTALVGIEEKEPHTNVVRSFTPGQPPKTVASLGGKYNSFSFGASSSRIALLARGETPGGKYTRGYEYERLASGPLGAPLSTLVAGCQLAPTLDESVGDEDGSFKAHSAIAIDGEVVAYDSFGCLVIHDFASGLQRVVPLAATLEPVYEQHLRELPQGALLRVAGRLIAYRANPSGGEGPASMVVYDIDTGNKVYSVPLPAEDTNEPGPIVGPTFDLQSDGTLVIADPSTCSATVSTIAAPSPRPLGIPACYVRRVRDGRVLVVAPGAGDERLLEWSPIEAPLAHPIADLGSDGHLETVPPDMNETTVLYELSGCYPRVYSAPLAEPGSPPALPESCPVSVSSPHATLTAKSLSVSLRCPLGCRGDFTAWLRTAKQLRAGRGGQQIISSELYTGELIPNSYSLAPNQSQTFKLLPKGGFEEHPTVRGLARELRLHPHLRLELFFKTDTPDSEGLFEQEAEELKIPTTTSSRVSLPIAAARR
jgi:hypothetical protein